MVDGSYTGMGHMGDNDAVICSYILNGGIFSQTFSSAQLFIQNKIVCLNKTAFQSNSPPSIGFTNMHGTIDILVLI